ncbi:mannitol dehydrogenase family protein [Pelagibacterium flavum]|uniref:Mannitol dehydrogenase family protein n=1 Tax=Pelagibacterium flavum TaxID=2984530 RepID=A0ABY6IKG6_9HYPH|nr:mannitol dehydrogenase family protein [Pelagibacterium sp. YIM 151497]UYQ71086.1 mannitol dehydrogenase family protein [Pelagibacterium sp. YIM 151497]
MTGEIVQFGTSRFLQAHADLMLSQARDAGQSVGPITVVETTGSPASRARVAAFAQAKSFPVHIRGLHNGQMRDERHEVSGIAGGLSARENAEALRDAVIKARYVLSNTGDSGYAVPERPMPTLDDWTGFPELLTALLRERFEATGAALTLLPCELISRNGDTLRAIVIELAREGQGSEAFVRWIEERCIFVNALVDRIVSEPLDPIGAVAEPYALWALEAQPGFEPPCTHEQMVVVPDLGPVERKKLFILNLSHTLLAQHWLDNGAPDGLTVREAMADQETRTWLDTIVTADILPTFPSGDDAPGYWAQCRDRFDNPFLNHRLADIASNHGAKIERRAKGFLDWVGVSNGRASCPHLRAAFGSAINAGME